MSGVPGVKWVIRRYQPTLYLDEDGASSLTPQGLTEQTYNSWRDVCDAADTILGHNCLKMGIEPDVPVVFQQGEDVVLIYMKLEI